MKRLIITLFAVVCGVFVSAGTVHAGTRPAVATVTSPAEPGLTLGLSGATDDLTTGTIGPQPNTAVWTKRADAVGAQIIRLSVDWAAIAPATPPSGFDGSDPSSPGYDWTLVDQQVRQLTSEGFTILIQTDDAPTWAEGPNMPASATPGSWEPSARDFGQFATALATRYDGETPDPQHPGSNLPRVTYWQGWNEPNLSEFLAPQWVGSPGLWTAASPTIYRNLENAFYTAVKAVSASNFVVGAGTAPYGDPPGQQRMHPVVFDQNLFCLDAINTPLKSCPGPTKMDAIDDHPYVSGLCCLPPTWHASLPSDTSIADVYRIVRVLRAAQKAHTISPSSHTAVWVSEIGWNTDPPNPNLDEASPPAEVGRWATQALYLLWSQGVNSVLWFQLSDDPESSAGWSNTFTEGLYYRSGKAKPAAAAFRFPFMTNRKNNSTVEAWGRAPASGTVVISRTVGSRWAAIVKLKVTEGQVFEVPITLEGGASFKATVAGVTSPVWGQLA